LFPALYGGIPHRVKWSRGGVIALVVVAGAAGLAWLRPAPTPAPLHESAPAATDRSTAGGNFDFPGGELPPGHPAVNGVGSQGGPHATRDEPDPHGADLPPGHPAVGGMGSPQGTLAPASDEAPGIRWAVPATWPAAPNPNAMRLATYRVQAAAGDPAELSVARAGGTVEANIQRWLGQFDDAGPDTRTQKPVRGLNVTIVEVTGTYLGAGAMMGGAPTPHPHWTLLAAIVENAGSPYFFKLTGPQATVRAAHAAFERLVDSITPS
jgi:hypothetical protein